MQGTFKEHEKGNYTPKQVQENDFLNDKNSPADLAKFGKTYSVQFDGDVDTYLWTAKTEPEVGKEYYGHIQPTSGKMYRFKVDKLEDGNYSTGPAKPKWQPKDEKQVTKNMVWKNLLGHYDVTTLLPGSKQWEPFWKQVDLHTEKLLPSGSHGADTPSIKTESVVPSPTPVSEPSLSQRWKETIGAPPSDGDEPYIGDDEDHS